MIQPRALGISGWSVTFLYFILSVSLSGWTQSPSTNLHSSRIEELFIWKISEELKLSVQEEKSLAHLISELNQRKSAANEKIENLDQQLAVASSSAEIRQLLKAYRMALLDYNKISTDEVDQIRKLLPVAKVAKYIAVKSDLSKKIRNLLAGAEKSHEHNLEHSKIDKPNLGDPKIIEE